MSPRVIQIASTPWQVGEMIYADNPLELLTQAAQVLQTAVGPGLQNWDQCDPQDWLHNIMGHGNKLACAWDSRKGVSVHPHLEATIECGPLTVVDSQTTTLDWSMHLHQTVVEQGSQRQNRWLIRCRAAARTSHYLIPKHGTKPGVRYSLKAKSKLASGRAFHLRGLPTVPQAVLPLAAD